MNDELDFVCDLCGRFRGDGGDVPSVVTAIANYGSTRHDGDKLTLQLCGDCIDWLMDSIPEGAGEWERVVPW